MLDGAFTPKSNGPINAPVTTCLIEIAARVKIGKIWQVSGLFEF
jgi:hypothetical protein